jgi:hypothetical protein
MTDKKNPLTFYEGKDGWRWRLTAGNNEIVGAASEAFSSEPAAVNNFLLLITMGNAEISRVIQANGIFVGARSSDD